MGKTRDSANLVSDKNITIDIVNDRVGIGSTVPTSKLQVIGDGSISGVITATTFNGNIVGTAATFTGNVSVAGTLTYEDVTNVDSIGIVTARSGAHVATVSGNLLVGTTSVTGTANQRLQVTGGAYVSGSVGIGITIPVGLTTGSAQTLHLDGNSATLRVGPYYSTGGDRDNILIVADGTDSYLRSNNERFHIYNNSGNTLFHGTNDTETVRITGVGSLGVGNIDPYTGIHLYTTALDIVNGNAIKNSTMAGLTITHGQNTNASVGVWFGTDGNHWCGISGQRSNFSSTWGTDLRFYTHEDATNDLTYTRERVRITSSGSIGIGTTNPNGIGGQTSQITAIGSNAGGGAGYHQFLTVSNITASNPAKFFRLNSTGGIEIVNNAYTAIILTLDNSGNLSVPGNVTAYSSDERLKENVKNLENPLEKVLQLNGCTFDWNEKSKELGFTPKHETNDIGLLAQEVEKVLPQAVAPAPFDREVNEFGENVSKSGENYLTIQYERLVPLLVEAIKEQQEQINTLRREIEELKK